MATHKHTGRNHAAQFVNHLRSNERNALRILLLSKTGLADLREALGTVHMRILSEADIATGHARRGSTIELFRAHHRHTPANLEPGSRSVEV